jgi:hypothetical protein
MTVERVTTRSIVVCECGGVMGYERGQMLHHDQTRSEWGWWRCQKDPLHVTRAIPTPVEMAQA